MVVLLLKSEHRVEDLVLVVSDHELLAFLTEHVPGLESQLQVPIGMFNELCEVNPRLLHVVVLFHFLPHSHCHLVVEIEL